MAKRIPACVLFVLISFVALGAQEPNHHQRQPTLTPQTSGTTNLIISVSPVDSRVVWAGAANGTFLVTTDGGNHWRSGVVPGAETLQFRDVQGVSSRVAYLMSIGDNPTDFRIYKTLDGGSTGQCSSRINSPELFTIAWRSGRRIAAWRTAIL